MTKKRICLVSIFVLVTLLSRADSVSADTYPTGISFGDNAIHYIPDSSYITANYRAGMMAFGPGTVISAGDDLTITTSGSFARGAFAWYKSRIDFGNDASITTSGNFAQGVFAWYKSRIDFGDGATINTSGEYAHGAYARHGSDIYIGGNAAIATSGNFAHGAFAWYESRIDFGDGAAINTSGDHAHGVHAQYGSDIYIGGNAAIITSGDEAHGAYARYKSYVEIGEGAYISAAGDEAHAIYANDHSSIDLNGAAISAAGADSSALYSKLDSKITGSGIFNIIGDMYADGTGGTTSTLIDLTLKDGSLFFGKTSYTGDYASTALNLTLNGAHTVWAVTGDSDLTSLNMDGAVVDFNANASYMALNAVDLGTNNAAGGLLGMKMDVVSQNHDLLTITGSAAGSYIITAQDNDGSAASTGNERLGVVEIGGSSSAAFALTHDMELGGWRYTLREVPFGTAGGSAWEIYSARLSNSAEAAIQTLTGSYMLAYAETTLVQRMGDLRRSPHLTGIWARAYGGNSETRAAGNLSSTSDMDFWGVSIGYDRKLGTKRGGDVYVGAFFGYSDGHMSYNTGGSSNINAMMVGLYATYIHPNGFYADSVLKYRWRESDFNTYDSVGTRVWSDKMTSGGFGWSIELGKRMSFNGTTRGGWYAEPQVQLRYQRQGDGFYNLSNGLRIGTDDFTSLIGRVGMLIGYETERMNFYGKIFRAREFDGDLNLYANGAPIEESFGGSWWIYGIGLTMEVSDRNNLYVDLERTSGNDYFDQKWRLNAGWRIEL